MKKNQFILWTAVSILTLSLTISSCDRRTLEPEDSSAGWLRDDFMWDKVDKNGQLAGFYLNFAYSYLPDGFNRIDGDFLDAATDDATPSRLNTPVENYTNGRVSVANNPDPYWAKSYEGIRHVNIFLSNIDVVPITEEMRSYWKAEARFIRALLYFELLKRYGGIPLIGDKVFTLSDDLELPRNTYEECVNYIASECNAIKGKLRLQSAINDSEWGKISRGAALALKSRLFLYAASPLHNGGGIETDPSKKILTGYPTPKAGLYDSVMAATAELRTQNYYRLHTGYSAVFTAKKNNEIILAKQVANNFSIETNNAPIGYTGAAVSNGRTSPSQNFVNAFPNDDGTPYTGGSDNARQYQNRDSRLAASVFLNGSRWLSREVELFEGGRDKPNRGGATVQTKTGYYLRKFMSDFSNGTAYSNVSHNFPIFRYAEIILNHAEALNETGRTEQAVQEIIELRKRAVIKPGTNNRYGIPAGISQAEMQTLIRNERRIELSFEEHRFWDVRRWKIADVVLSDILQGISITKTGTATYTFQPTNVGKLQFTSKLYHMPIPYTETIKNRRLIQNEGW
jgi:hypothetical protein